MLAIKENIPLLGFNRPNNFTVLKDRWETQVNV